MAFFTPQRAQRLGFWLGERIYRAETAGARAAAYGRGVASKASTGAGYAIAGAGVMVGLGGAAATYAGAGAIYEARHASGQWKQARESAHMSRILSTMQTGPFGNLGRPYGMSSNYGNSAGMSLALHYGRQGTGMRDPFFGMAGNFVEAGRFLGG